MCLIVFAIDAHPAYSLLAAANRDEFHRRATAPAAYWEEPPGVLAGRDLVAGGTWLGITRGGRFAALTNYREPGRNRTDAPSRGTLVSGYLTGSASPADYATRLSEHGEGLNGFNLVLGEGRDWVYLSNRGGPPQKLTPGVYGLSNHLLDSPWPKVTRTTARMRALAGGPSPVEPGELLSVLDDRVQAPDDDLPATGVPLEWERLLSAPCIVSPEYGTRSSTAVLVDTAGRASFVEQARNPEGEVVETRRFTFLIER